LIRLIRLILVRHGRPDWQTPRCISLSQFRQRTVAYDATHLSQPGSDAIRSLAARLPEAAILSSDLLRARETAEILGRGRAAIRFDPLFRELQAPIISRCLLDELRIPPIIWSLVHWFCWLVGIGQFSEGPRAAWHRAAKAAEKILSFADGDTLVVVSHGWFISLLTIYLRRHGLIVGGPLIPQLSFGGVTRYWVKADEDEKSSLKYESRDEA
jgi:broad specificity phosphatase PhoE